MIKARFFHMRSPFNQFKGGATIYVEPAEDPYKVSVRTAFCSRKDNFHRKNGRDVALSAKAETIALRDLGEHLMNIQDQMIARTCPKLRKNWQAREVWLNNWDFAIRYFLPKA